MKRRLLFAAAALVLCGFTLYSFTPQTGRVRWEVDYRGAAYNTAVPEETNLRHCFKIAGYDDDFGQAIFRTEGFQCTWGIAGSGGATGVEVKIVHSSDAGIDCQCNLGACNAAAGTQLTCSCGSIIEMGRLVAEDGGEQLELEYCVQVDDATDCAANPAAFSCSLDLFR